ncbi:hypothetical protein [Baaleninema simplex]|uniref:hypothetical protein n=1 Tax=Baaleninema simplex TaxID=2862350 RepID=UPI000349CB65|nr:hypothetical protein [Baaleninema simplex]
MQRTGYGLTMTIGQTTRDRPRNSHRSQLEKSDPTSEPQHRDNTGVSEIHPRGAIAYFCSGCSSLAA